MSVDSNTVRNILLAVIIIIAGFLLFSLRVRVDQISSEQTKMSDTIRELEQGAPPAPAQLQKAFNELQQQFYGLEEAYEAHVHDEERHSF